MTRIREIHLWGDGSSFGEYLEAIQSYFKSHLRDIAVTAEGNLWDLVEDGRSRAHAENMAGGRVFDLWTPLPCAGNEPMRGEIAYEEDRILGRKRSSGLLYDGFFLSACFRKVLGRHCTSLDSLNIVITDRLTGSFDRYDRRYHARVVIFGFPSVLSTIGVVEAPARPREYYIIKARYQTAGAIPPEIDAELKKGYIDHGDPRTGEILKGYALQAFFYQETGDPFCDVHECRLYNAHWQEEMIRAQLTSSGELCEKHAEMLSSMN